MDEKRVTSVLVALMTSELAEAPIYRLALEPTATNGLRVTFQIMVDKIVAMPCPKCGPAIGRIDKAGPIALVHMLSSSSWPTN